MKNTFILILSLFFLFGCAMGEYSQVHIANNCEVQSQNANTEGEIK